VQPAVVTVDSQGKFAYVSNIRDATIGMYAINQTTGVLTPLSPATAPSGALPQDFTLHPSGNFAYSANSNDDTVTVFSVRKTTGQLTPTATVKVPGYSVASPNSLTVDPAGKFLYVVGQYVEIYSIDATTGGLSILPEKYIYAGTRAFKLSFDPTGQFAYVPDNSSSNVYEFAVNATTGTLTALNSSPITAGSQPAWVATDPTGKFAYVSDRYSNEISVFSLTAGTGSLTLLAPDTVRISLDPWPILFDPSGQLLYVLTEGGTDGGTVTSFATNPDGSLRKIGSVATGHTAWSFAIVPGP
jgi:6-phosphogluconolactonase (cycloisomerase 2 family)